MVVRNEVRARVVACGVDAAREAAACMAEWASGERVYEDALEHDVQQAPHVDTSVLDDAFSGTAALECAFCGSTDVVVDNRQMRSKDEAETAVMTCRACGRSRRL